MEQTSLVVTPDGKTWDEVTRDVSYIGNMTLHTSSGADGNYTGNVKWTPELYRGVSNGHLNWGNKDFAIAYDRWICLKDGQYKVQGQGRTSGTGEHTLIMVNGADVYVAYSNITDMPFNVQAVVHINRGDYVQLQGEFGISNINYNQFSIIRLS